MMIREHQPKKESALPANPTRLIASAMNEPSRNQEYRYTGNAGEAG
jgi:hypothetical protein